jgi:hypothetical protein
MRWMVVVSTASWLVLVAIAGFDFLPELTAGMAGPLAVALTSWWGVARAHRTNPMRVTNVLLSAFVAKVLFFGVYVVTGVRLLGLRPVPFALCLTGYFVVLYAMQALMMRRLFMSNAQASA